LQSGQGGRHALFGIVEIEPLRSICSQNRSSILLMLEMLTKVDLHFKDASLFRVARERVCCADFSGIVVHGQLRRSRLVELTQYMGLPSFSIEVIIESTIMKTTSH
jgi:hypothetical protein